MSEHLSSLFALPNWLHDVSTPGFLLLHCVLPPAAAYPGQAELHAPSEALHVESQSVSRFEEQTADVELLDLTPSHAVSAVQPVANAGDLQVVPFPEKQLFTFIHAHESYVGVSSK
jgi:hypothetical protein